MHHCTTDPNKAPCKSKVCAGCHSHRGKYSSVNIFHYITLIQANIGKNILSNKKTKMAVSYSCPFKKN